MKCLHDIKFSKLFYQFRLSSHVLFCSILKDYGLSGLSLDRSSFHQIHFSYINSSIFRVSTTISMLITPSAFPLAQISATANYKWFYLDIPQVPRIHFFQNQIPHLSPTPSFLPLSEEWNSIHSKAQASTLHTMLHFSLSFTEIQSIKSPKFFPLNNHRPFFTIVIQNTIIISHVDFSKSLLTGPPAPSLAH